MFDEHLQDNKNFYSDDTHCLKDLDLDSFDMLEIVMCMEEEFGIEISDCKLPKSLSNITVGDLKSTVEKLIADTVE